MSPTDWNFLGNHWALRLLQGQLANQRLSHAYLLTGPPGIGRRTLALNFAQALLCAEPPAPAHFCGRCPHCRRVLTMQHPDLHLVQVQEGDRQIKIEAIRELNRALALMPYEADKQIALLLNFEQASRGAANALLKTLEEPSPSAILLLTAHSAESLPATIASRCEVLRLRPMPQARLAAALEASHSADPAQAQQAARFASGRPGQALRLLREEGALQQREAWLQELQDLLAGDSLARFAYADELAKDREALAERLRLWLAWWREQLLAEKPPAPIQALSRGDLRAAIATLQSTLDALSTNVNLRLTMESLLLSLPRID